jgi:hypothetical protein
LFQAAWAFCSAFLTSFVIVCLLVLLHFDMESVKEQTICVKFCFELGKTAAETHNLPERYSDDVLS